MKIVKSLLFILVITSCQSKVDVAPTGISESNQEDIILENYHTYDLEGQTIKMGTSRIYYLKGEQPVIFIKNLPSENYKIKVNGEAYESDQMNKDWMFETKNMSTGIKKYHIQIINENGKEILNEDVTYEIGYLEPDIDSEHGDYLYKGISSKIEIFNLGVTCPYIRIHIDAGEIITNADGSYTILPSEFVDNVTIRIEYNGRTKEKHYQVIEPPSPKLIFKDIDEVKCLSLKSSEMFKNVEYTIVKMKGVSLASNTTYEIENNECIADSLDFVIHKLIYKINNSNYIDTMYLN